MVCKFEIRKTKDSKFFFSLVTEDGTELLRGLPHFTKTHARKDAESVSICLGDEKRIFKKELHGELYFALLDAKHEMFARSRHVKGPLALDETLDEAKTAAASAVFIDVSERPQKRTAAH